MAQVKIYSQKDKTFKQFLIKCDPSKEDCKKCPLKNNCNKKKD